MPDYLGRRTLGDQRPIPAFAWETGPRDPSPAEEDAYEREYLRKQAEEERQ